MANGMATFTGIGNRTLDAFRVFLFDPVVWLSADRRLMAHTNVPVFPNGG